MSDALDETDWEALLLSLEQGNCVLLLGDEVSRDAGRPLKALLAEELAREMHASPGPLPAVAREYQRFKDGNALRARVARFFRSRPESPSPLHDDLAALPFPLVLTSCHDRLLEQALERRQQAFSKDQYNFRAARRPLAETGSPGKPLVYSLYGSIEDSASLVLTENDLLDFLVAVVSENPPVPDWIRSQLKDPMKTFLFVGLGIRQWYLRILLHVLRLNQAMNRSFALEELAPPLPLDLEETLFFYRTGFRIEVIRQDAGSFVRELRRLHTERGRSEPVERGTTPAAGAASVFISYVRADEDRAAADKLYQALRTAGLRPWMDRDLETGERWDPAIEKRIAEADYFVVLLTRALAAKTFGYVNKEINLALDRQLYARRGTAFILPVRFGDAPIPTELADIQVGPLDLSGGDFTPLTSLILRDHQRRHRAGLE